MKSVSSTTFANAFVWLKNSYWSFQGQKPKKNGTTGYAWAGQNLWSFLKSVARLGWFEYRNRRFWSLKAKKQIIFGLTGNAWADKNFNQFWNRWVQSRCLIIKIDHFCLFRAKNRLFPVPTGNASAEYKSWTVGTFHFYINFKE